MRMSLRNVVLGFPSRSLPALPLPTGARVMAFGHSFIANGHFTGTSDSINVNAMTSLMLSDLSWVRALDQRFNVDSWADTSAPNASSAGLATSITGSMQGIGGDQLIYSAATKPGGFLREPYIEARRPDIIWLVFGVNDILYGGYSDANTLISLYDRMLKKLRRAGIWVVAATIAPVGAAILADGDARLAMIVAFNAWLKGQATANRAGLKVFDVETILGVGRPSQSYWLQTDGLHPQERGCYAVAQGLLAVLQSMVSPGAAFNIDPTVSNLMPNAGMTGTGGSKTGVTGNVANNYNVNISVGTSTVAASKETINGSYDKQVFTITPVNDGTTVHSLQFQQNSGVTLASLGLAAGDWIQGAMRFELSAWDYWVRANWAIFLSLSSSNKWTTTILRNNTSSGAYILPNGGLSYWAISEPLQIPSNPVVDTLRVNGGNAMLALSWLSAGSGTGTIKVSQPILRKVSDPRSAWKL